MSLQPQALVSDVVNELNGSTIGPNDPYSLFNVAGVTSGQIYSKITAANAFLQGWTGVGGTSGTILANTQIKWFEVNYAAATLAADLIGVSITDGFNVNLGGLAVQRSNIQYQAYKEFIDVHLAIAKEVIKMLHPWFFVYNSINPQGSNEYGSPVTYWNTSQARDYGG